MVFYIARHGQDKDNECGILNGHRNTLLTDLGRRQAIEAGKKLKDKRIDVIWSSPLVRTFDTAAIIAEQIGFPCAQIVKCEDLIERNFGILTGKPLSDILALPPERILKTDKVNYFLEAEGAENFSVLLSRGKAVLELVKELPQGKTVLLVTHGDIGKMIQAAYYNWTWEDGLKKPYFANTDVLELK